MILGIGIDLVSITRIEYLISKFKNKFSDKFFTTNEIFEAKEIEDAINNGNARSVNFFAKRFAAKEAFSKAIGLGIGRGINFKDIEILNDEVGKPYINLLNQKDEFVKKLFSCKNLSIHLSLSDEKSHAIAMVIIEKIS